jgi:hypothetical protein
MRPVDQVIPLGLRKPALPGRYRPHIPAGDVTR